MAQPDEQQQDSSAPTRSERRFEYSPSWVDRTFNSRRKVEGLLGPEVGHNLARRDYDVLLHKLPGPHFTDFMGVGAGIASIAIRRKPSILLAVVASAAGDAMGQALRVYTHLRMVSRLENRNGFARAMENVKKQVGFRPGMISFSVGLREEEVEQPFAQMEPDTPPLEPVQASPSAPPTIPPQPGKSRWDELRAKARVDTTKAWDNIRQGRRADGSSIQPGPTQQQPGDASSSFSPDASPSPSPTSFPTPYRDEDQAAAQAAFDALVDRERNMRS